MSNRFHPEPARQLRDAIIAAEGVEVFAIGDVVDGEVSSLTVACRGQFDRVLALIERPRSGQVVIHNHPSGDIRPSDADMSLAARYSEDGVGFVIVDSAVSRSNWVVEPFVRKQEHIEPELVARVFHETLASVVSDWEPRASQIQMALAVTSSLNKAEPVICEAGTGTGKSLAYLVPAALWAKANDARVVVATHTRALQAQILSTDLPWLSRAGIDVRTAVLEGRSNYLCKRRLGLAKEESDQLEEEERESFEDLLRWSELTREGSRSDLANQLHPGVWDRVSSDTDLSLKTRCEHYADCHFYTARRRAADAHVVVVNHALLLADLFLKAEIGRGVLPSFDRLVIDEGQHLEDVATQAAASKVTGLAIRRAVATLLPRRRGKSKGALQRLANHVASSRDVPSDVADAVCDAASEAAAQADALATAARRILEELLTVLGPDEPTRRVDDDWRASEEWQVSVAPPLRHLLACLDGVAACLEAVREPLENVRLPDAHQQPLMEVARAIRRLTGHAATIRAFVEEDDPQRCRWIQVQQSRKQSPSTAICTAAIDVAPLLQRILWAAFPGTTVTSATLSIHGDFRFWRARVGLREAQEHVFPSPFDYFQQALLGLPRDLPPPGDGAYERQVARVVVDAIRRSGGGAFVLCTSFRAVDSLGQAIRAALGPATPVFVQGTSARATLLERFRQHHNAVLVGTDSFWEGVSVKGRGLRLVIIPRLPFRVPTAPLERARYEAIEARGGNAFRQLALPRAVLKVRQGFGRLIRSTSDTGVVMILDVRIHERGYGRVFLQALPNARRLVAPTGRVLDMMARFFEGPLATRDPSG